MVPYWKIFSILIISFFQKTPVPVEKLNSSINSKFDEINPVISTDGKTLYFTRVGHPSFDKTLIQNGSDVSVDVDFHSYLQTLGNIYTEIGEIPGTHPFRSSFNQDIWIAESSNYTFDKIHHPKYPLNSALPNSVCAILNEPSTLAVINQFYKDGSMYKGFSFTTNKNGKWQFPQPLHIYDYYNLDPDANLSLSQNGELLLLSINRKDSRGDHDIYISNRVHETLWSSPKPLGPNINTQFREVAPFLSSCGKFLFFSSNRPGGYGGNDIYMSIRLDDSRGSWTVPVLLPESINSEADESQPFLHEGSGYLYFISTRDGSSDIFRSYFDYSSKRKYVNQAAAWLTINSETLEPSSASLLYQYDANESLNYSQKVDQGGLSKPMTTDKKRVNQHLNNTQPGIPSDELKYNSRIPLKSIYFKRSKSEILEASFPALDNLVYLMRSDAGLHIQINGHTDNIGKKHDLFVLSEERASAVKDYLVRNGIQSFRISTRGYGEEMPITDNSTEEKRAMNRRVEAMITKV